MDGLELAVGVGGGGCESDCATWTDVCSMYERRSEKKAKRDEDGWPWQHAWSQYKAKRGVHWRSAK